VSRDVVPAAHMTKATQNAITIFARVDYAARGLVFVLLGVRAAAPWTARMRCSHCFINHLGLRSCQR